MNKIALGVALAAASILAVARSPFPAAADDRRVVVDQPFAHGTVEIDGVTGDIDVRPAGSDRLTVTAHVVPRGSRTARVAVERHADRVIVCTVYAPDAACEGGGRNANDDQSQIDYAVAVPAGVALDAKDVNGAVRGRGLTAPATIATVDGDITAESAGPVSANTVNGKIDATARVSRGRSCAFHVVNGRVSLTLLPASNARVAVSTLNGSIDGNGRFSFSERSGEFVGHTASGTIGDGSGNVSISTVNGDVRVTAR